MVSQRIAREVVWASSTDAVTDRGYFLSAAELHRRSQLPGSEGDGDLSTHELRVSSQNGEDGVIAEILRRIGPSQEPYFVEFGIERGVEGNCVALADLFRWRGLFIEADADDFRHLELKYRPTPVDTLHSKVTAENIDSLLTAAGVPSEFDVLSIDVNGVDYWIWRALKRFRPRLVIIEFNSELDPSARLVVPQDFPGWDETTYFGASQGALVHLAASKGYRHVHTELAGVNLFFVRDDVPGTWSPPPSRGPNFFLEGHAHTPDPRSRQYQEDPPT